MVKNLCVCEWEAGDGKEGRRESEGKVTRSTQQHFPITVDCSKHILYEDELTLSCDLLRLYPKLVVGGAGGRRTTLLGYDTLS